MRLKRQRSASFGGPSIPDLVKIVASVMNGERTPEAEVKEWCTDTEHERPADPRKEYRRWRTYLSRLLKRDDPTACRLALEAGIAEDDEEARPTRPAQKRKAPAAPKNATTAAPKTTATAATN